MMWPSSLYGVFQAWLPMTSSGVLVRHLSRAAAPGGMPTLRPGEALFSPWPWARTRRQIRVQHGAPHAPRETSGASPACRRPPVDGIRATGVGCAAAATSFRASVATADTVFTVLRCFFLVRWTTCPPCTYGCARRRAADAPANMRLAAAEREEGEGGWRHGLAPWRVDICGWRVGGPGCQVGGGGGGGAHHQGSRATQAKGWGSTAAAAPTVTPRSCAPPAPPSPGPASLPPPRRRKLSPQPARPCVCPLLARPLPVSRSAQVRRRLCHLASSATATQAAGNGER